MKASVISAELAFGDRPVVIGLSYDLESLTIVFDPDTGGNLLQIVFENPRGFRCLDEGDLQELWDIRLIGENWLFEVIEDGWLDHEAKRSGFISKDLGLREFLVRGADDCISVISDGPPVLLEISAPS
jgi:hypothetical protein